MPPVFVFWGSGVVWVFEVWEVVLDPSCGGVADDGACGFVDDLFGDVGAVIAHEHGLVDDGVEVEGGIDAHAAVGDTDLGVAGDELVEGEGVALAGEDGFGFFGVGIAEGADGVAEDADD